LWRRHWIISQRIRTRFGRFKDSERNNNAERNNDEKKSRRTRDLTRGDEIFVGGFVRKQKEADPNEIREIQRQREDQQRREEQRRREEQERQKESDS
jgi:hypothetical protein